MHRLPPESAQLAALALTAIDEAGLQAPSLVRLENIIRCGSAVEALLCTVALREPSATELEEIFRDVVVRCVNRAPGIGDAVAY